MLHKSTNMKYTTSRQVIAQVTGKTELSDTLTVQECMDVVHAYAAQNFPHSDHSSNCPGIPPYHIYSERTLDKKDWSVFDDLCEVCQHSIRAWMYHPCDWWMVMRAGCENTKMSTYSDNNN